MLSPREVVQLLAAALLAAALPGRERTLLDVAYSCGLRLKELLGLQVRDIDSARMVLHIRHGNGQGTRTRLAIPARHVTMKPSDGAFALQSP